MVPISVIVAVAIVCIVVAVLTSARHADDAALEHEQRLFTKAIANHAERVLRELESVATSDQAVRSIRVNFDPAWVQRHIGLWLKTFFDHDFVFVADGSDRLIYALLGRSSVDPNWFNAVLPDLSLVLDQVHGRPPGDRAGAIRVVDPDRSTDPERRNRAALVQVFMGRPAVVAAVPAATDRSLTAPDRGTAPVVLTVRFIDEDVLAEIASRLQLRNLRKLDAEPPDRNDYLFNLVGDHGKTIAYFTWTPRRTGTEIVRSVVPFILVALSGFALLAALVYRYMRHTAAAIAEGEDRLRHLALHDPLCGLPNRRYFGQRLEAMIDEVRRGGPPAAVFYIDLDHFKDVNDTLGHPVGDDLIRSVTNRLTRTLRGHDVVARLGGDEFAVIATTASDQTSLQTIAARMISSLCAPYSIEGHTIVIGASIGIAVIDRRSEAAADIMRYADMALYRAKNEGRNRACIYDSAMDADLTHRKHLENDLRHALETDSLQLLYQPVVNPAGDKLLGVEALSRWRHPVHGDIQPTEFIPIAENSGLIIKLGGWVLRRACLDGKAWPGLTVAVNVSPLQFRRTDFVDTVERILSETNFDPTRLELELTESTLLGNLDSAESAMLRLKATGVRIALDDFGTGYSSLLYLRRFPFDKLKIDSSFVRSIEKAADAAAIVHAVVSLGRGLGMKVTAEGVETAEQQLFLRAAGVHSMQGYRFGEAETAEDISARIAATSRRRDAEGRTVRAG